MDQQSVEILTSLTRNALEGRPQQEFKPRVTWNKHLDEIRVIVKECGFYECDTPHPFPMVFLENENPENGTITECVGFVVVGMGRLCKLYDLKRDGAVNLRELLDVLARKYPQHVRYVEIARALAREHHLETVRM